MFGGSREPCFLPLDAWAGCLEASSLHATCVIDSSTLSRPPAPSRSSILRSRLCRQYPGSHSFKMFKRSFASKDRAGKATRPSKRLSFSQNAKKKLLLESLDNSAPPAGKYVEADTVAVHIKVRTCELTMIAGACLVPLRVQSSRLQLALTVDSLRLMKTS